MLTSLHSLIKHKAVSQLTVDRRKIGYLAQCSISDSDRGGLKRIRWQPMPAHLKQRRR